MEEQKECPRCHKVKPIREFFWSKNFTGEAGVLCKKCRKEIFAIEKRAQWIYKLSISDKKKYDARRIAMNALKRGDLDRPYCCEECGKECVDIEMHHWNYDKPLTVYFVCTTCHSRLHERYKWIDCGVTEPFLIDGSER